MMDRDKFNRRLTLILVIMAMIGMLVIFPKEVHAEVNPYATACECDRDCNKYSSELYSMWTHDTGGSTKKTYMDYRAITNTASNQYKFQQRKDVWVDEYGFLVQNSEWYVVAMGSYWGEIGDKFLIYLKNGEIISVVIGDIKADRHTDSKNYAHATDGHVIEFLIDSDAAYMGSVGIKWKGLINKAFPQWDSKIVDICKVVERWDGKILKNNETSVY